MTLSRKLYTVLARATRCSGQYAGLPLVGFGFDAALGFDLILNVLGFS